MAVTGGFFNAVNGDRKYDAEDFGSLFDGIIRDGVFKGVGNQLAVRWANGRTITVDTGRAWFRRTWTDNSSLLQLTVDQGDVVYNRKDSVVLKIDKTPGGRRNSIYIKKGIADSQHQGMAPTLDNSEQVLEVSLADIYVPKGSTTLSNSSITNNIGNNKCPWVTAPLEYLSTEALTNRLQAEWTNWSDSKKAEFDQWFKVIKDSLGAAGGLAELAQKVEQVKSGVGDDLSGRYNSTNRLNLGFDNSSNLLIETPGYSGGTVYTHSITEYDQMSYEVTSRGFRFVSAIGCIVSPTPDGRGWDIRIQSSPASFKIEVDMTGIKKSVRHAVAWLHSISRPSSISDWRATFGGYYLQGKWVATESPNVFTEIYSQFPEQQTEGYDQKSNFQFNFPGFQGGTEIRIRGFSILSNDTATRMNSDHGTRCIPADMRWVEYQGELRTKSGAGLSKHSFTSAIYGPDCIVTKQKEWQ